ncbi:MAG: methionine adenosyltransferase [Syntrophotaleaceae bacterium]
MKIDVVPLHSESANERSFEIVERKGQGHPDTMCDGMMEAISVALSRAYLQEFDRVLHHNVDKGLLAAGAVERWFGGGRLVKPMQLVIGDRATPGWKGRHLDVGEIAREAAQGWLRNHLRFVDPAQHLQCRVVLGPSSAELTDIFARPGGVRGANDTSAAVGYYPLSPTEEAVLRLERYLNSTDFKERFPDTGEDVKVMAIRRAREVEFTVAMPLLAGSVASEDDYFSRKELILDDMEAFVGGFVGFERLQVRFNTLDRPGRGLGGVYLSLLGTSAEDADSGQVGRGNRVNGLIAVGRPLGTEAVAGKNPVSHVGKIYNVLAHRIARTIFLQVYGLKEIYVYLVSRIGAPIDQPQLVAVQVLTGPGASVAGVAGQVREICATELASIDDLCRSLAQGEISIGCP